MEWHEIRQVHPTLPEDSKEWHQHSNGGGWCRNDADISDVVYVGPRAVCYGGTFYGGAFHGGTFYGGTFHGGTFHGGAFRGGTFRGGTFHGGTFYGGAFHDGTFHGGAFHGGTYVAGTFERTPILIRGSRYWMCWAGADLIASGCIAKPVGWWLKHVEQTAKEHDYTQQQQREYRMHVEHIVAWMRLYGYLPVEVTQ